MLLENICSLHSQFLQDEYRSFGAERSHEELMCAGASPVPQHSYHMYRESPCDVRARERRNMVILAFHPHECMENAEEGEQKRSKHPQGHHLVSLSPYSKVVQREGQ